MGRKSVPAGAISPAFRAKSKSESIAYPAPGAKSLNTTCIVITLRSPPPLPLPPVFAAYFAEATKAKKATTGRPVRPNGSFRGLPQKANY